MSVTAVPAIPPGGGSFLRLTYFLLEGSAILTRFAEPAEVAAILERGGTAASGLGDCYTGYAAFGVAFVSGDVLALRRFPRTSRGPAYTAVWHYSPDGTWTLYSDVADYGCARYFGPALDHIIVAPIRIEWTGPRSVSIAIDGGRRLIWSMLMRSTPVTRAYDACAPAMMPLFVRHRWLVAGAALIARSLLRTGPLRLAGATPTGARFLGRPWRLWIVRSSRACIDGRDTGTACPLDRDLRLGDVVIPRRGLFAAAHLSVEKRPGTRDDAPVPTRAD